MAYKPNFDRNPKGAYEYDNSFVTLNQGSDAYLLEDTVNEIQWAQVQNKINENARQFTTGYLAPNSDFIVSGANLSRISFNPFNVMLGGLSFNVMETRLPFNESTTGNEVLVYLEVAFQKISPTATEIAKNGAYRQGNPKEYKTIQLIDQRLNMQTAGRVQFIWNINSKIITSDISTTIKNIKPFNQTTTYNNTVEIQSGQTSLNIGYSKTDDNNYIKFDFNDKNYIGHVATDANYLHDVNFILVPLLKVIRRPGATTVDINNDIELLLPISSINNGDSSTSKIVEDLEIRFAEMEERLNNLSIVMSDQEAYGLSMAVATNTYIGSSNLDGRAVQIKNYSQVNDNIVYQITNLGNNYYGQIGERWTRMNNNYLQVSNTGKNNVMFQVNHFRDDNDEVAYKDINSNSTTGLTLDLTSFKQGTATKNISSWDFSKCIICAIPKYSATQSTVPSIGSWWLTKSGSTIKFYNSGATNIPFRIFVLLTSNNDNLVLKTATLNSSTIVNDAFGRHHEFIASENFDMQYIMLGTPIYTGSTIPNDIDLGEIYLEKGKDNYMISTTSNGLNVQIPYLIFKTAYKIQEGDN